MEKFRYTPKKRVSVSFAGADEIVRHMIDDDKKTAEKKRRSTRTRLSIAAEFQDPEAKENIDIEDDLTLKFSNALINDSEIAGADVFGFKTPKKSGQMAVKACESAKAATPRRSESKSLPQTPKSSWSESKSLPQTPKSSRNKNTFDLLNSPRTPKSAMKELPQTPISLIKRRRSILQETGKTPVAQRSSKRVKKIAVQTPQRLRARTTAVSYEELESCSSEDSALSGSESDGFEDIQPISGPNTPVKPAAKLQLNRRSKSNAGNEESHQLDNIETYFDAQSTTALTSDRTLAKLNTPRMDREQLLEALVDVEVTYKKEKALLYNTYRAQFQRWMFLLCNNYNLLFYGLGSKQLILEEFRQQMIQNYTHIVVNGFFPSLTIKSILNSITEDVIGNTGSFRSPLDQCEFINSYYTKKEEDVFLLIHNIDGDMLRPAKVQTVLSLLAQVPGFHIIASIDHINAPLIWDQTKCSRFNWLWFDVTTYESYVEETSYENSLLVQQSGGLALSSLTHVMKSLTPNAKGIFLLLARYQIDNKIDSSNQGLAFPDLYQKCRESFLVNSDLTLRTQLTEFKDHKLIRVKKGHDGVEYLTIPLDDATLKEFLEQQEDS